MDIQKGIFAVNKPRGITSYDVIRKVKKQLPNEKIGHGGTLDPLASGILVLAVGKEYTKKLHDVLKNTQKTYIAEFELGKVSETDDSEGPIKKTDGGEPGREEVKKVVDSFVGNITQVPPRYSAIKIKGVPAYKRARRGEEFVIEPKEVYIDSITIKDYTYPTLMLKVVSGSGVYIRSLARDIGEKLGTGAYMKNLQRTRVGDFSINETFEL